VSDSPPTGARIVVRWRVGGTGPTGGPALTDTVGRVLATTPGTWVVERRDGRTQDVPVAEIVTWKTVPDRPLRRRRAGDVDPEVLTAITSRGWPAVESEMLGEWELRAAGGFTGRANSAAATGSSGVDDPVSRVAEWYQDRSLPPLAQVVTGTANEHLFLEAGWGPGNGFRPGALVQVADLDAGLTSDPDVVVDARLSDAWLALYGRVDEDPTAARAVIAGPPTVGFARLGDPVEGIARVVVTGEWAGIAAVEVRPDRRRTGLATRLVSTALAWAVDHGADKAYLQTMRDNSAALALYAPFGFTDHHEYRYLQAP
jgi:GNAT superfamily N-acetyltransferase